MRVGLSRLLPMLAIALSVGFAFAAILLAAVSFEAAVLYAALRLSGALAVSFVLLVLFCGLALIGMLASRWFVAIPVCIVERSGAWRSLRRSAALTKGARWRIFAVILLFFLAVTTLGQILVAIVDSQAGFLAGLFASIVWRTFWGAYFATFVVVTYYELRTAQEGIDIDQIASVFD